MEIKNANPIFSMTEEELLTPNKNLEKLFEKEKLSPEKIVNSSDY